MLASDIYTLASAFLFERPYMDRDFEDFFLPFLNSVLAEAYEAQCFIDAAQGKEKRPLPEITDMNQNVDYDLVLCRTAIPFGIASYYFQDEGAEYKAQDYRARFVMALREATRTAVITDIKDVFRGEG